MLGGVSVVIGTPLIFFINQPGSAVVMPSECLFRLRLKNSITFNTVMKQA